MFLILTIQQNITKPTIVSCTNNDKILMTFVRIPNSDYHKKGSIMNNQQSQKPGLIMAFLKLSS